MTAHHTTKTCRACRNRYGNVSRYGDPLGHTPPGNPRLPWAPVDAELRRLYGNDVSVYRQAMAVGAGATRVNQIHRWRRYGLEVHDADRIAVRLGHHPSDLWGPEYWTIGFHECETTP